MNQFDLSVVQQNLQNIDNIYETLNIYKSLLVVSTDYRVDLYASILSEKDYPVATMSRVDEFNADMKRMLILSHAELETLDEKINDGSVNIDNITITIYVDPIDIQSKYLDCIREFFL